MQNYLRILILFATALFFLLSCNPDDYPFAEQVTPITTSAKAYGDIDALTRAAYRIDMHRLDLTVDYHPRDFYFQGSAVLTFTMLRNQDRPIFHLDPIIEDPSQLLELELDGEILDSRDDWQIIDGLHSSQKAIEIQRRLSSTGEHSLKIRYKNRLSRAYTMLNSQVSDLYGIGNELSFPCINRFGDPLHHLITFRVHGDTPFRCLGSGRVSLLQEAEIQSWQLDSVREVPSNTVMFVLLPVADSRERNRTVSGVAVRMVSFIGGPSIDEAYRILEPWLSELNHHFGPFPMPEGFSVFLIPSGGGMEYYGGTISSLWALKHETFHMYFGTSLILSSYRDSWIDEAVNEWYELSALGTLEPINEDFSSNMVSGRSPVGLGFDRRAYYEGAQIMEHIARQLGGREAMIAFLAHLHENHAHQPFSTLDFLDFLEEYSGLDYEGQFSRWLYSGETVQREYSREQYINEKHRVDTSPPSSIFVAETQLNGESRK